MAPRKRKLSDSSNDKKKVKTRTSKAVKKLDKTKDKKVKKNTTSTPSPKRVAKVAKSKADKSPSKTQKHVTSEDFVGTVVETSCGPPFKLVAKPPTRSKNGCLEFEDFKDFYPNLTPKEVLQAGSFGGTYFRPIKSAVTGEKYSGVWKELPSDWIEGLDVGTMISSSTYDMKINKYGVKCGGSLQMWEESGWINPNDPYGWFMWYCRFYRGRRIDDDLRQIGRWQRCAGVTGRWKNNLISKIVRSNATYTDVTVSPVVRQTLLHWAYELTEEDFKKGAKKFKK